MAYGAILGQTPDLSSYATKNDLNDYLPLNGGTMNGSINMNNQKIVSVANGTSNNDVVNLGQLNSLQSNIESQINDFPNTGLNLIKRYAGLASSSTSYTYFSDCPIDNNLFIECKVVNQNLSGGYTCCLPCFGFVNRSQIMSIYYVDTNRSLNVMASIQIYNNSLTFRNTSRNSLYYDIKVYTA